MMNEKERLERFAEIINLSSIIQELTKENPYTQYEFKPKWGHYEVMNSIKPEKVCDIIDIAEEELKTIDSTEIDQEFEKVFNSEYAQGIINLINVQQCTKKDLDEYKKTLKDSDILDLRISNKSLYIKTTQGIVPYILSQIMGVDEQCIDQVPINGKYLFFVIDCEKWATVSRTTEYLPSKFVTEIKNIGSGKQESIHQLSESLLEEIILQGLNENWEEMCDEIYIQIGIEDEVIAIGFDRFIPNAKEVIAKALQINPILFIEVSSFNSTVLLIDAKRWVLDENFGEQEWYQ